MGHNITRGRRAISLPGSITYAFLPYTQHSESLSEAAYSSRKEVIVHLPMSNLTNHPIGPDGLTDSLSESEFRATIARAVKQVPHAKGINNHTGSYLTQKPKQMKWLMDDLKQRDLFFVDSRTTAKSVARNIAREKNILTASRDVFLDNDRSTEEIDKAFKQLVKIAKRRGTAIGIGHPYRTTLDYLESAIPKLGSGIQIISVSNLIALQQLRGRQIAAFGAE